MKAVRHHVYEVYPSTFFYAGSWRRSCYWLPRERALPMGAPAPPRNEVQVKIRPTSLDTLDRYKSLTEFLVCTSWCYATFGQKNKGVDMLWAAERWLSTRHNTPTAIQAHAGQLRFQEGHSAQIWYCRQTDCAVVYNQQRRGWSILVQALALSPGGEN